MIVVAVQSRLSSVYAAAPEATTRIAHAHASVALGFAILEGAGGGAALGVEVGVAAFDEFGEEALAATLEGKRALGVTMD